MSAAFGFVDTALAFGNVQRDLRETTATISLGRQVSPAFSFVVTAGAVLDGSLGDRDIAPGVLVSVAASYLFLFETEDRPFILGALSAGVSTAQADDQQLTSVDFRLSLAVGKTWGGVATTYAVVRGFGGPVFWMGETGSDIHHYVVGFGLVWRPSLALQVFAEGAPLGERSVTAGVGVSF